MDQSNAECLVILVQINIAPLHQAAGRVCLGGPARSPHAPVAKTIDRLLSAAQSLQPRPANIEQLPQKVRESVLCQSCVILSSGFYAHKKPLDVTSGPCADMWKETLTAYWTAALSNFEAIARKSPLEGETRSNLLPLLRKNFRAA